MKGLIGRKVGMTQLIDQQTGVATPVTVVQVGPCYVTQVKTPTNDGYQSVQLGFDEVHSRRLTKGEQGHLKRTKSPTVRVLREFRVKGDVHVAEGEKLTVDVFTVGDYVDVIGTSKGKGFQGVMKRHGFSGGDMTHGQSDRQRAPGSVGAGTTPGRVYKGTRMAGHMGVARKTQQNLVVMAVDPERNLLAIRGAVPGAPGGLILVREARKARKPKKS